MSQPATRGVAEPAGPRRRAGWLRKAGASPLPPSSSPEDRARARAVKRAASAVPKGGAQPPTLTARARAPRSFRGGGREVPVARQESGAPGNLVAHHTVGYVSVATHSNRPDLPHFLDTGH